jgi:uncharacterized membrane protein
MVTNILLGLRTVVFKYPFLFISFLISSCFLIISVVLVIIMVDDACHAMVFVILFLFL